MKFKQKYGIPFKLLADADSLLYDAFGVHGTRSTFLLDANGTILRVWSPVKVAGHADEVYAALP